ncbi:MAG TPA: Na/Pi symporter [Acidimicrobiia bacterium]|jgi:sodium-dependent phosphate cotransporter|nr:Na/Pi symporter [Acidimicrobiia bacterium]
MTQPQPQAQTRIGRLPGPVRAILVVAFLYLFLGGVKLLETGIKGLGSDLTDALFENVTNPLAGLSVGVLATVLVQSSSVTTATIVGLVAAGVVDVPTAVPMIMGANIGTTVTNTIVAVTHIRHSDEFRRAFTAATMHDFFNVIAVAILLPIELLTGFLSNAAEEIALFISGGQELGGSFDSPVKGAVSWFAGQVESLFEVFTKNETALAVLAIVFGIVVVYVALTLITKNMKVLVADRIERSLNAALARSGLVGMAVGTIVTIAVQSSSITTSILIPLCASGILLVRNAYPITLGANVGTTVTALIAALGAGAISGLTIAVTHTLFNIAGILLIYPWSKTRYVPVAMAERLADLAIRRKTLALLYLVGAFVVVPLLIIVIL